MASPASIVFWLGPTAAGRFDPRTALATGVGGSETAAIHLSRELARLGHEVAVWADVTAGGRDAHGVAWYTGRPDETLPITCDLFISSRHPGALRAVAPRCRRKWLWVHDLHCGPDWENEIGGYDRVLCLTKWAREKFLSYYPGLDPLKVAVTSNAVDLSLFRDHLAPPHEHGTLSNGDRYHLGRVLQPGNQHLPDLLETGRVFFEDGRPVPYPHREKPLRVTFSSSPDRGLDNLLDYWPEIVAMVASRPAELHVYYGFDTWKRVAELHGSDVELVNAERLEARLAAMKGQGVFHHGRAGQAEVARSYLQSQLWLYPTDFLETSCCHPDTMISLPGDHRLGQPYRVKISDLVGRKNFPVYTYDIEGDRFRIGTALWCAQTKVADDLIELGLDDGSKLRLTADHKVMNFESQWVEAGSLEVGDRLMALHHRYEVMIKDVSGRWVSESRLVGEWMAEQEGKTLTNRQHVDHSDPLRLDNNPKNLQVLPWASHFKKTHLGSVRRQLRSKKRIEASKKWFDENLASITVRLKKNGRKLWETVNAMSPEERKAWCAMRAKRKVISMRLAKFFPDYKERVRHLAARHSTSGQLGRGFWDWLDILPFELRRLIIEDTREGRWNHRIVSVRKIPGGPVFDMEVAKYHNFVADGVVVHNCITAMEAQAAHCKIVATRCGALPETAPGAWLVDGPTRRPGYRTRFIEVVREVLCDDSVFIQTPRSWEDVAAQWDGWLAGELRT